MKPSNVDRLISRATAGAEASKKRVERLAKLLADEMQVIHGDRWGDGGWRFHIDHDVGLVLVRPA